MQYHSHQLSNGLTILAECNPQSHAAAFGFFVRAGARDERPEIGGVSHFLEHMVFKGTPRRSAEEVNLFLDEMGSHSNARTGEESTIYHAAVLPEFQSEVTDLLADIMRPSLREDDFKMEQQVIIEEIRMYADQPPFGGYERIMESFFGSHPLGQSVLGTEGSVGALTVDQMMDYFQQRYSPSNMAFAAAGNVDFEQLVGDLELTCGAWQTMDCERETRGPEFQNGFISMVQPQSAQQYLLQLAPGPSSMDERRFAARVAASILGDDGGSRMYWEFLDSGMAESAGLGGYEYLDCGALMTFVSCAPQQAQANLRRLRDLQANVLETGVTEKELELAKRKIASAIVLASERTESRMFNVGSQWLTGLPFKSVAEVAAAYEAVTMEQVNDAIRQFPLEANMTLVVGPVDDLHAV